MRTELLKIDNSYKVLYRMIKTRFSRECADKVFSTARTELAGLYRQYAYLPKGDRAHTDRYIFPRIAALRAMQSCIGDEAMPLMDELIRSEGSKAGSLMGRITAFPLMKGLFLRIFAKMAKSQFGETKGFRQQFHTSSKNKVSFDILDCPYCRYCRICGCPELIHTFCDSDAYCFGNLLGITFTRTETLEHGQKCDFTLTRE